MKSLILALLFIGSGLASARESQLRNFYPVSPGIYRGGRPGLEDLSYLKENFGLKTVIDLQGGDLDFKDPVIAKFMAWWEPGETPQNIASERAFVEANGMNFVWTPLNSIREKTDEEDAAIDRALAVMADPTMRPLIVHCERGLDRTGLVIALYRVLYEGVSEEDAYNEWVQLGHKSLAIYFTGNLDKYFRRKVCDFRLRRKTGS